MAEAGVCSSSFRRSSGTADRSQKFSFSMPPVPPTAPSTFSTSGCFLASVTAPYSEELITAVGAPP